MAKETETGREKTGGSEMSRLEETYFQRNLFLIMALNMTWQLAIVVLLPVVGGYYLDQHFGTTPILVIIGAVIAVLGVAGVLRRVVMMAGTKTGYQTAAKKTDKTAKRFNLKEVQPLSGLKSGGKK
jgi:F0F1-type ATP synthase assembly protein I